MTFILRGPTIFLNCPDSIFSMASTADESVKYPLLLMGILSDSLTLCVNLKECTAATNSILGMVIFTRGATGVLPVPSLHLSCLCSHSHLRCSKEPHASLDLSQIPTRGVHCTVFSGHDISRKFRLPLLFSYPSAEPEIPPPCTHPGCSLSFRRFPSL
jgi:hypothetical protein